VSHVVYRHTLPVRITHWINAVCLLILMMSGLQIFNAHPRLYFGEAGADADPAFIEIYAERGPDGALRGRTSVAGFTVATTGVLGVSSVDGRPSPRAWPKWITLPGYRDLAGGRHWHFFFAWLFVANGLAYLAWGFASGHFRRDFVPSGAQLRGIGASIIEHLKLHRPRGAEAARYNVLQKLAYLVVVFMFLPLMVLAGLAMSPGMDSIAPVLLDLLGGRQTARTIHFITSMLIVLFFLVHIFEVFVVGFVNEMRAMITGRFVVEDEEEGAHDA